MFMQKYLKNVLITFGIIMLAWGNTYVLHANKLQVEDISSQFNDLSVELDQSKQREKDTLEALKNSEKKIQDLISQKQKEEASRLLTMATPRPVLPPTTPTPTQQIQTTPVAEKPVIVKITKPSRSTRAS